MTFPTTLRELVGDEPLFHVYTEYRGCRYYVASETTYRNALQRCHEYRIAYPRGQTYIKDRADSTQIDGAWAELKAVYVAREERLRGMEYHD
jgi:hypothetical protein